MTKPPPRRIDYLPISEIPRADENAKDHDERGIAESIERHGFIDALVLDGRTGKLLGGHGRLDRLEARKAEGADPPEGVVVDGDEWLVPVQTGWSSADDDEADAAALALNQLTIAGGFKEDTLTAMLSRLASTPKGLVGTGFARRDLASMLRRGDTRGGEGEVDETEMADEAVRFWLVACPEAVADRVAPLIEQLGQVDGATITQSAEK